MVQCSLARGDLDNARSHLNRLENLLGNAWKYTGKCAQAQIVFERHPQRSDTYTVREYMQSRTALGELGKSCRYGNFMRKTAIFSAVSMLLVGLIPTKLFINIM